MRTHDYIQEFRKRLSSTNTSIHYTFHLCKVFTVKLEDVVV